MRKELIRATIAVAVEEVVRHILAPLLPFVWLAILWALTLEILGKPRLRSWLACRYTQYHSVYPSLTNMSCLIGIFGLTGGYWFCISEVFSHVDKQNAKMAIACPSPPLIAMAWNEGLFYRYYHGVNYKDTISPINVLMPVRIRNLAPYPIRLTGYRARVLPDDGWLTRWRTLIPMSLASGTVVVNGTDKHSFPRSKMIPLNNLATLDGLSNQQVEATRDVIGWVAFEYPGFISIKKGVKIEMTVISDVAGSASDVVLGEIKNNDAGTAGLGGTLMGDPPGDPIDLSHALFKYADVVH